MEEAEHEHVLEQEESDDGSDKPSPPYGSPRSSRLQVQRSSVCSRAYFVVVMVFFHVYILNVIALLLYVHYNNGVGDLVSVDGASAAAAAASLVDTSLSPPGSSSSSGSSAPQGPVQVEDSGRTFSLPRIEGIRVGHVQQVSLVPGKSHKMVTLSLKPLLFEIPGFLTEEECRVVVQLAQLKGLMESLTPSLSQEQEESNQQLLSISTEEVFSLLDLNQDGLLQKQEIVSHSRSRDGTWLSPDNLRQILSGLEGAAAAVLTLEDFRLFYDGSQQPGRQPAGRLRNHFKQRSRHTWLHQGPGSHHVLQTLRSRVATVTRLPPPMVELSEPLQVVRYEPGDFSHAHHDSSRSHQETSCMHTRLAGNLSAPTGEVACRYLTVLFLLSSVGEGGETSFPVADNRTYDEEALIQDGLDLTDTQQTCSKGNLRIKPTVGTALLWYNHLSDGRGWMGELDEYALRGDCPVRRGLKWTANSWVNVDPDFQKQARYQKLVARKVQAKSVLEEQYRPLPHSDLHQDL